MSMMIIAFSGAAAFKPAPRSQFPVLARSTSRCVSPVCGEFEDYMAERIAKGERDLTYAKLYADFTELQQKTRQLDEQALQKVGQCLYPLIVGISVYTLVYGAQKSWWSWMISSLANGVYTFGFVMMTPQLFINYRLKSVAHLPWRVFMYKGFNTFIDDVFAFIIAMPTAHRVACLRDDIVFFIFLYQMWLYPVDMKRANSSRLYSS